MCLQILPGCLLTETSTGFRAEGEEAWQPDYASLTWVVQHSLRLGAPHVLGDSHRKVLPCCTLL